MRLIIPIFISDIFLREVHWDKDHEPKTIIWDLDITEIDTIAELNEYSIIFFAKNRNESYGPHIVPLKRTEVIKKVKSSLQMEIDAGRETIVSLMLHPGSFIRTIALEMHKEEMNEETHNINASA